ncbi:MAG: hypothetical protein ACREHD_03670, partial [Pirellulales bacterium]
GYDEVKRQLASIDPIREKFGWNPEGVIISRYSGYLLVPRRALIARRPLFVLGLALLLGAFVWRRGSVRRGGATSALAERERRQAVTDRFDHPMSESMLLEKCNDRSREE